MKKNINAYNPPSENNNNKKNQPNFKIYYQ
jgi:hypothetical protein